MPKWTAEEMPDQSGRIAIVTGANSGLGYETTLALARKGAQVVMACRNLEKGQAALDQVQQQAPNARLDLMKLDLASLASIHEFADAYLARYDRLDLLINNAGLMAVPRRETEDGFEMQFGVNHLGHFALTGLLLPALLRTPGSRAVTVSSMAHFNGRIDFDDLMREQSYSRYGAYGQSKLANVLFAVELQRRLEQASADTISVAAHPGYSDTELQSNSAESSDSSFERLFYGLLNKTVAQSSAQGALPQLYAATMPDVQGGDFWGPHLVMRGYPKRVRAKSDAYDPQIAARLWAVSEELTGVSMDLPQRRADVEAHTHQSVETRG
jgi:NAD(P)-dependent dehydrogenase (short-subunit alcohol dehydrogenase family)